MSEGADNKRAGWIDWRLSTGNILTILVVIGGMVAGWYQMKSDLKVHELGLAREVLDRERLDARVSKMEIERDDTRDRLTRIEVTIKQLTDNSDRILRAVERVPSRGER